MLTTARILIALAILASTSRAQLACSGTLSSPATVTSDVSVKDGSCTIVGINIAGSVRVASGASLRTTGQTLIQGSVSGASGSAVTLSGSTRVNGDVGVSGQGGSLVIGRGAKLGTVSVSTGSRLALRGSATSVGAENAGSVEIRGGSVAGGGVSVLGGTTGLTVCGARVSGGLSLFGVKGGLRVALAQNCAPSTINGSVLVEKGEGAVHIRGATLMAADINIVEQKGDILLADAQVGDVLLNNVVGNVEIDNVSADSDASIGGTDGSFMLHSSRFQGDVAIKGTIGAVRVVGNDFGLEAVSVSGSGGLVTFANNRGFSASIIENTDVRFVFNNGRGAEISKNVGATTISNNALISLSCSDNAPALTGSRNSLSVPATGQCRAF